jgi:putative ABC transport system substrate-binding protein
LLISGNDPEVRMTFCLRRREFIAGLGGAATWPLAAGARQGARVRRIGVLMSGDGSVSPLTQALAALGWIEGRNVRMDLRFAGGDLNRMRAFGRSWSACNPTSS